MSGIPTMIQHHCTEDKVGVVITVLGRPFTARFQLYDRYPEGTVGYDKSGGEWMEEAGAIRQFKEWKMSL